MGKSAEAAAETRRNIVTTAAAEFRESGFDKVGVAELLSRLGLTHGGFYRHFESKDQLIREALQESFGFIHRRFPKNGQSHTKEALEHIVSNYLCAKERDNPRTSCMFSCLGSELSKSTDETRSIATQGFRTFTSLIQKALPKGDEEKMKQEAASIASSLIGTLMMSRLVADRKLSNGMLAAGREQIMALYADRYDG